VVLLTTIDLLNWLLNMSNDYNEAIKIELDNADNYAWRGSVYIKLGNKELAKKDFDKAFSLEPENEFAKDFVKELN